MSVSCWMLLGLEESIKVPERALDEVVRRHFRKATTATKERERDKD